MSELHVQVVTIDEVMEHPNADRLELLKIAGWQVVAGKGEYRAGDRVVYLPIDSVLPGELEARLFPPDSKVKLSKSRIRTIKLRGAISQGMVISLADAQVPESIKVGTDVAAALGITKYEPPTKPPAGMRGNQMPKRGVNPNFRKYTDIENFKHYPTLFGEAELVYVSEKLHGTSARYAWSPTVANTLWKKVKRFLGFLAPYEFCIGSRNVQLQDRRYDGFYDTNVYGKIAKQEMLESLLDEGDALYGEIVGDGIQSGYTYGCKAGEHEFYAYDVMRNGQWLGYADFVAYCAERGIRTVPELYVGPFDPELISNLRNGDSMIGGQKVREGVVIKPVEERSSMIGRAILKYLNDEYLLKDQTDFH